jgi:hypothetical protein
MPRRATVHRAQHLNVAARIQARSNRRLRLTYDKAHSGIIATFDWREGCRAPGPPDRLTRAEAVS